MRLSFIGNELVEFKLGNIPFATMCRVDAKCVVIAASFWAKETFV